jgi:hypothetical protein
LLGDARHCPSQMMLFYYNLWLWFVTCKNASHKWLKLWLQFVTCRNASHKCLQTWKNMTAICDLSKSKSQKGCKSQIASHKRGFL